MTFPFLSSVMDDIFIDSTTDATQLLDTVLHRTASHKRSTKAMELDFFAFFTVSLQSLCRKLNAAYCLRSSCRRPGFNIFIYFE